MARMTLVFDGRTESDGAPICCHNDRLADPLDPFTLAIGRISKKRKKSEADHLEVARLEYAGGLYHDGADEWLRDYLGDDALFIREFQSDTDLQPDLGPYIPGWNLLRCIQEAGKRHKLGVDILRGLTPLTTKAPIEYDGPRDIDGLWFDGRFALRKSVGISRRRVARTRPLFVDWQLEAEFDLDVTVLDPERINQLAAEAGRYIGLCEMRPIYGRFKGSAALAPGEIVPGQNGKRRKKVEA